MCFTENSTLECAGSSCQVGSCTAVDAPIAPSFPGLNAVARAMLRADDGSRARAACHMSSMSAPKPKTGPKKVSEELNFDNRSLALNDESTLMVLDSIHRKSAVT